MQALEGLRVIELGNILAGPWCGTLMADFGAEVIKIEPPIQGDLMRSMGRIKDFWFAIEGRNKKNITLDLKTDAGKAILKQLIVDADVLIQNFRPGVFEKLGFTWELLQELNPRLIYVCASGYGQTGPDSHKPGFDRIGLALGGFLNITGEHHGPPIKPGISVADFYTAMFACIGVMFAIYNRDVRGTHRGQMIDCCLTESMLRLQESIIAEYSYDGTIRERMGNGTLVTIPSGHFLTKDNQYLVLSVTGDKLFQKFAEATQYTFLLEDPKWMSAAIRQENREYINQLAANWASQHTIDECLAALGDQIPCCKVFNVKDIVEYEQFKSRNAIIDVSTDQFGIIKMQNITPKLSATPGVIKWAGGAIGKFNDEIYGGLLKMTEEEIKDLKNRGII